jgi:peroxiredoxin
MNSRWIILLIVIFFGCNRKEQVQNIPATPENITIEGILEKGIDQLVTLDLMGSSAFIPIDSVRCDEKGRFTITFPGDGMNFYSLKYTENGYVTIIAEPGDKIELKGIANSIYPYSLSGSPDSDLVRVLADYHSKVLNQLREISIESENIIGEEDYVLNKQDLMGKFDSITSSFHQFSKEFILSNPASPAILIALYNQFGPGLPVFHPLTDLEIYQFTDSALYENFPENEAVQSLHSQLTAAMHQLRNQQKDAGLKIGDLAPDFVLETFEGEKMALSDFREKYVILQVWASWSKPSAEENRFLKECSKKYADKAFAIVQVSIDSDKLAWESSIPASFPNWYHLSDLGRWESAIVKLYRIERIPANFLISPKGRILEIDTFGEELEKTVQKYIN